MAMASTNWHSRRRFFVALGIISVMLVAGVSAVGLVDEDPGTIPATFGVPAPKQGDRAEYVYSLVEIAGGVPVRIGEELPIFSIEFGQGTPLVTAEGDRIEASLRADSWSFSNIRSDYESNATHWGEWLGLTQYGTADGKHAGFDFDADLSALAGWASGETDPTGLGLLRTSTESTMGLRSFNFQSRAASEPFGTVLPCGAIHALQGRQLAIDEPVTLASGCMVWGFPVDPTSPDAQQGVGEFDAPVQLVTAFARPMQAVGWQTLVDGPALAFRSIDAVDDAAVHAWFDADIPFPVKMAVPADDGRYHVLRLATYSAVDPAAASLQMEEPPAPVIRAMRPWGPDDSGIEFPFPASAAWAEAMKQDDVQALLDGRPDAVLSMLRGDTRMTATSDSVYWDFQLEDLEGDLFGFSVRWDREAPQRTLPAVETPVIWSPLKPMVRITVDEDQGYSHAKPRAAIDAFAPTVASALATLQSLDEVPLEHLSWRTELTCQESNGPAWDECGRYGYSTSVTNLRDQTDPGVDIEGRSAGTDTTFDAATVVLDGWGGLQRFERTAIHQQWAVAPAATTKSTPPSPTAPAPAEPWLPSQVVVIAGAGLLGILAAAAYYFAPGILGLFSRINEDDLLDHPSRRLLHDAVQAQPGVHHQALVRTLGKGRGTAGHHLDKLTAAGLVTATQGPGYTCYFPRRTDRRVIAAGPALRSENARNILATLQQRPGCHGGHVAQALGINRATVSHHLQRMETAGLIETRRDGRAIRAYPTQVADMVSGSIVASA